MYLTTKLILFVFIWTIGKHMQILAITEVSKITENRSPLDDHNISDRETVIGPTTAEKWMETSPPTLSRDVLETTQSAKSPFTLSQDVMETTQSEKTPFTPSHDVLETSQSEKSPFTLSQDVLETAQSEKSPFTISQDVLETTQSKKSPFTLSQDVLETTQSYRQRIVELQSKDICQFYGTCMRGLFMEPDFRFCHCDLDCVLYNDCCIDVEFDRDPKKELPYRTCVRSQQKNQAFIQAAGIITIDRCPYNYPKNSKVDNCFKNFTQVGPFVVDKNGTVYKNRYCAECHGVFEYTFYNIEVSSVHPDHLNQKYDHLNQMERLELYLSFHLADYTFVPPNGTVQRRCAVYEDTFYENETSECKDYGVNPIITVHTSGNLHMYRNAFCNRHEGYFKTVCYGGLMQDMTDIVSLTAMFSFSSGFEKECNNGEEKINDICVALPKYKHYLEYVVVRLVSTEQLELTFLRQLVLGILASMTSQDAIVNEIKCFADSHGVNDTLVCVLFVKFYKQLTTRQVIAVITQLKTLRWEAQIISNANHSLNVFLVPENTSKGDVDSMIINSVPMVHFIDGSGSASVDIIIQEFVYVMKFYNVYRNVTGIFCFHLFVKMVKVGKYLFIEDITCLNSPIEDKVIPTDYLKPVITYVGCSVSIVALFVSILVSRKLHLSKSIPGNNLENLSISLCASNLLFMLGIGANDLQVICYVLGIILHYLWLVSFSFMTLTVTFLCYSLLKMVAVTNNDKSSFTKTKLVMTLTGLFFPVLLVLPSVILDRFEIPMFEAMYAGTICFPTGTLTNLVFFSGPIIVCLLVNFVTMIILIIYFTRHNKKMTRIRRSQTYQQGEVYVRVCLLAGLTWILAIIGSMLDTAYIDFITIILCSLQGLGVALGNLTTKQVLRSLGEWRSGIGSASNATSGTCADDSKTS